MRNGEAYHIMIVVTINPSQYVHCFVICYGEKLKFQAGQVIVNMLSRRRYNITHIPTRKVQS